MVVPMIQSTTATNQTRHILKKNKGLYLENPNNVPEEVLYGILDAMRIARYDHVIGIYSYLFTPITRLELADRYIIKSRGGSKSASLYYINKYIVAPTFELIKAKCSTIKNISVLDTDKIHRVSCASKEDTSE